MILRGTPDESAALIERHGLQVEAPAALGGGRRVDRATMASLSGDPAVSALAADRPVYSTMSVTTEATGAQQVWAGLERSGARTGPRHRHRDDRLGLTEHGDLRGRIAVHVDFTAAARGRARLLRPRHPHRRHHRRDSGRRAASAAWRRARTSSTCGCSQPTAAASRATSSRPIDWAIENQAPLQHPRAERLAGPPGDRGGRRRPAGAGGRAGRRGRHRGGLLGRQPGQAPGDRPADRRRHQLAGQLAERHHGRRPEHQGHGQRGRTTR